MELKALSSRKQSGDSSPSTKTAWLIFMWMVAILLVVIGIWASIESGKRTDSRMRRELIRQVVSIAKALPSDEVLSLSFTHEDLDRPEYQLLCRNLKSCAQMSGFKSIYTMALCENGELVFGPESLDPADAYASEPGEVYQQPSPEDFEIFETGIPVVMGPNTDEYGTFISASAPFFHPETGKVLLTVGIDVEASAWQAKIRRARLIPIPTILIPTLMLAFGCILLTRQNWFSPSFHERFLRHTKTIACAITMLLLTASTAYLFYDMENEAREEAFHTMALIEANTFGDEMKSQHDNLESLVDFFRASKVVDRDEFNSFCASLINHRSITKCTWFERISPEEIPALEQQVREEGLVNFAVQREDESQDRMQGEDLYPAVYVAPPGDESDFGYNPYLDPQCRLAMDQANKTGHATSSGILDVTISGNLMNAFHIFTPAFSGQQKGLLAYTIVPKYFVEDLSRQSGLGTENFTISLLEVIPGEDPRFLACSREDCTINCNRKQKEGIHRIIPLFSFDRTYALLVSPEPQWFASRPIRNGQIVLVAGLILTGIMTELIRVLSNRPYLLERLVQQRTRELRDSERKLKLTQFAMDHHSDGAFWVNEAGELVYLNHAGCENLGYSEEELLGMALWDIDPNVTSANWPDTIEECKRAGSITLKSLHRRKDGSVFPVEIHGYFIEFMDNRLICGIAHDITLLKQAEETLQKKTELLVASQQIGHIGSWELDLQINRLIWSEEAHRIFDIEPEAFNGTYEEFLETVHPDDRDMVTEAYAKSVAEKRDAYEVVHRIVRPNGEIRHVHEKCRHERNEAGEIIHSVGICQDITEQKHAEEKLRESEERFRSTINDLQVGVVLHNPDTSIILCNPAAARMLGVDVEEAGGKVNTDPARNFVREDLSILPNEEFPVNQVLATGKMISNQIFGIMRPDCEEPLWCNSTAVPIFGKDDQIERIIVNFADISELKQTEQNLTFRNNELERFNKMMTGRELRMIELKSEINVLSRELGRDEPYRIN